MPTGCRWPCCAPPPCPGSVQVQVQDCCASCGRGAVVILKDHLGTTQGTCTIPASGACNCTINLPFADTFTITATSGALSGSITQALVCDGYAFVICLGRAMPATLKLTDPAGNIISCTGGPGSTCGTGTWTGSHTYNSIHPVCANCLSGCNPSSPYATGSVTITYTITCQVNAAGALEFDVQLCASACNCPVVTGNAGNPNAFASANGTPYGVSMGGTSAACSPVMASWTAMFQDCNFPFGSYVADGGCGANCGNNNPQYTPGALFANVFGCGNTSWTLSQ